MSMVTQREATVESQSLYNLALGKISRNNYTEALAHLSEAVRIAPGNAAYLSQLGLCVAHSEADFDQAEMYCQQAVDASPADPAPLVQLARVYRLKGENQLAHAVLLRAHKLNQIHAPTAAELTRMGIRRPPFIPFLPRNFPLNVWLGILRAQLERRLLGHRAC